MVFIVFYYYLFHIISVALSITKEVGVINKSYRRSLAYWLCYWCHKLCS